MSIFSGQNLRHRGKNISCGLAMAHSTKTKIRLFCFSFTDFTVGQTTIIIKNSLFIYLNRPYYDVNRLLCISEYLFKVQLKNRLEQKGLLKRFTIDCYGNHKSLEDIRSEKSAIFKVLKSKSPSSNKKVRLDFPR